MSDLEDVIKQELPEYVTTISDANNVVTIAISKVGGGTRGRAYEGHWEYWWFVGEKLIHHNSDLYTGTLKTHAQAAIILADFMDTMDEMED